MTENDINTLFSAIEMKKMRRCVNEIRSLF